MNKKDAANSVFFTLLLRHFYLTLINLLIHSSFYLQ